MPKVSKPSCFSAPLQVVKQNKAPIAILSALVAIGVIGVLLNYYVPAATTFFETTAGRWSIIGGGIALVAITAGGLICLNRSGRHKNREEAPASKIQEETYEQKLIQAVDGSSDNDPSFYTQDLGIEDLSKRPPALFQFPPNAKKNDQALDKLFQTVKSFQAANIGDYKLEDVRQGSDYKKMTIHSRGGEYTVLVRESSSSPKNYYIINKNSAGMLFESTCKFTASQISTMVRLSHESAQHGYQVSNLSQLLKPTGLIVFKTENPAEGKKYYIVHASGAIVEASLENILKFAKKFMPKK